MGHQYSLILPLRGSDLGERRYQSLKFEGGRLATIKLTVAIERHEADALIEAGPSR